MSDNREEVYGCDTPTICHICDEPKCIGRSTCPEVEAYLERLMRKVDKAVNEHIDEILIG